MVAAIDLNPFSRTAQTAHITIVDEARRATKNMIEIALKLGGAERSKLEEIVKNYDNRKVLAEAFKTIMMRLSEAAEKGVIIEIP
jgi:4-phosphopantoate--beta-alanine ligase